ncbi:hypothetical protein N431DRAFT_559780 [Stipitochalara longipes BDJ]|nr:hypothetical protein N431DRAFT_559780 [Stipitochalara longipes BDJ]
MSSEGKNLVPARRTAIWPNADAEQLQVFCVERGLLAAGIAKTDLPKTLDMRAFLMCWEWGLFNEDTTIDEDILNLVKRWFEMKPNSVIEAEAVKRGIVLGKTKGEKAKAKIIGQLLDQAIQDGEVARLEAVEAGVGEEDEVWNGLAGWSTETGSDMNMDEDNDAHEEEEKEEGDEEMELDMPSGSAHQRHLNPEAQAKLSVAVALVFAKQKAVESVTARARARDAEKKLKERIKLLVADLTTSSQALDAANDEFEAAKRKRARAENERHEIEERLRRAEELDMEGQVKAARDTDHNGAEENMVVEYGKRAELNEAVVAFLEVLHEF